MKEVFLVKHAVGGRTFIHSGQSPIEYSITNKDDNWTITVQITPEVDIAEILRWKDELNVFLFQEFSDKPTVKIWFYVKEGSVAYNEQLKQLTIHADSRIDYVPSEFGI